jgi:hypothetical protein
MAVANTLAYYDTATNSDETILECRLKLEKNRKQKNIILKK